MREIKLRPYGHAVQNWTDQGIETVALFHDPNSQFVHLAISQTDGKTHSIDMTIGLLLNSIDLFQQMVGELQAVERRSAQEESDAYRKLDNWLPEALRDWASRKKKNERELSDLLHQAARRIRLLESLVNENPK